MSIIERRLLLQFASVFSYASGNKMPRYFGGFALRLVNGSFHFSGLLDYRDWPHSGFHSPRTDRMTEKSAVTQSAIIVQTKKKPPLGALAT